MPESVGRVGVDQSWVPTTAQVPGATVLLEREQDRHGHGLYGICSPGAQTDMNQVTTGTYGCCQQPRKMQVPQGNVGCSPGFGL